MDKREKKRLGRPRKPKQELVKYQRIAVYLVDYLELVRKIEERSVIENRDIQLVDAFAEMVENY